MMRVYLCVYIYIKLWPVHYKVLYILCKRHIQKIHNKNSLYNWIWRLRLYICFCNRKCIILLFYRIIVLYMLWIKHIQKTCFKNCLYDLTSEGLSHVGHFYDLFMVLFCHFWCLTASSLNRFHCTDKIFQHSGIIPFLCVSRETDKWYGFMKTAGDLA